MSDSRIVNPEIKDVYLLLGEIMGLINSNRSKLMLALLGVIAAQIGVKMVGSPILLDIATIFGLVGAMLLAGALIFHVRRNGNKDSKLTRTGFALALMMAFMTITQILVFLRDAGYVNSTVIYVVWIGQNISMGYFGWEMLGNMTLMKPKDKKDA